MLDARSYRALLALALLFVGGCAGGRWPLTSKWAMADADYARKYSRPYAEGEKYPRMAKQMLDARHVAGKGGAYAGGAVQTEPGAAGIEAGVFQYAETMPWLEGRGALSLLWADTAEEVFAGATLGARAQSPSRIAPFVGAGAYAGVTPYFEFIAAADDGLDNDDDGFIDEASEKSKEFEFFAAIYPEVGLHLWATPRLRVTGSAAYMITSQGRDHDFWFFGVNLARLRIREGHYNWNLESPSDALDEPAFSTDEPIARLPAI